ncbi:MAG: hypothetical protein SGARI_003166 [Bacillariaceae sp.]
MMTAGFLRQAQQPPAASAVAAKISDRDVVDWPSNTDAEDDDLVVDIIESQQDDDYLYKNAHYQHHSKSTRRVVTPDPKPSALEATATTTTQAPSTREKLDEAERHLKVLESNVTMHKRLGQLEDQLHQRDTQMQLLQKQLGQLLKHSRQQDQQLRRLKSQPTATADATEEWDTAVVTWKIPKFEKTLTTAREFFESSPFAVSFYAQFYLTVCVLEVDDDVPESRRPVAIFLKAKTTAQQRGGKEQQVPSIFPIRLDGSKITLVSNNQQYAKDKTVQVGETQMEDAKQGKGVRQFTTLGALRQSFLQDDASVVVRATVRVPRIPIHRLRTI